MPPPPRQSRRWLTSPSPVIETETNCNKKRQFFSGTINTQLFFFSKPHFADMIHCANLEIENFIYFLIQILAQSSFLMICFCFYRRMFPTVRCSFSNLRPDQKYWVLLDIVPCDNKRYRYAYHRSSWLVAGKADPAPPHRLYPHPDAPYTGDQLRKQVVSFEKVKLTNNEMDKTGQVWMVLIILFFTLFLKN